ncbi:hypothetical protein IFM5058_08901 [Aspergillus udagawae]|nr:hypothetical protein IFM5058_08901 [Aspergillus udagawae]
MSGYSGYPRNSNGRIWDRSNGGGPARPQKKNCSHTYNCNCGNCIHGVTNMGANACYCGCHYSGGAGHKNGCHCRGSHCGHGGRA